MNIRKRLNLTFFLCLLIVCFGLGLLSFFFVSYVEQQRFDNLSEAILKNEVESVIKTLDYGIESIKYHADTDLVRSSLGKLKSYSGRSSEIKFIYDNLNEYEKLLFNDFYLTIRIHKDYDLLYMITKDGYYLQYPEGYLKYPAYDLREKSWYKELVDTDKQSIVTDPYISMFNNTVIGMMSKVVDAEGNFVGIIGINYDLEKLVKYLESKKIQKTGYFVVYDKQGRIIVDGNKKENKTVNFQSSAHSDFLSTIFERNDENYELTDDSGSKKYVVSKAMPDLGWKIAIIFDKSEVNEGSLSLLMYIVIACLLMFMISFYIVKKLGDSIADPIERLVKISEFYTKRREVTQEDITRELDFVFSFKTFGEITQLTDSMRFMTDALYSKVNTAVEESKAKSFFLANMSHEIRTPMNAIIGMIQIGYKSISIEDKDSAFLKIKTASDHLLHLINDILDMAKIESGKISLEKAQFRLCDIVANIKNIFQFSASTKNIDFSIELDSSIPSVLKGDQYRMTQVIANLVSNAIKFTPESGKISVDISKVSMDESNCLIEVCVKDTGIGISAEAQKRLFQPFQQAESDTTRKYGGTGLGLTICKHLVEIMAGKIWLESEIGHGTEFHFTAVLELVSDMDEAILDIPDQPSDSSLDLKQYTMLLVEDIEINREIIISLLEDTGIQIVCAENGQEAIQLYEASLDKFDIILMDLQMPVMDGIEASRHIRAIESEIQGRGDGTVCKHPIIIALTANVFREDIDKCREAGMDDHIGKPVDIELLLKKLRFYLRGK